MRVPLIISGNGIPKGKETHAMTCLLDVYPTLCDLIGISPPPDIEGLSLRPILKGTTSRLRDSVFLPFTDIQRAVVEERWKLICYPRIAHFELFDLHSDPHERTNMVDNPSCAAELKRLTELMKAWQTKTEDKLNLPSARKPLQSINLSGKSRSPDQWQPDWIVKKYFH
jgi:arylsulfatase A-like enzyme